MNKLLTTLGLLLSGLVFASSGGSPGVPLPADVETTLNLSAIHASTVKLGSQVTQKKVNVMKAVYDFTKLGGSSGASAILRDASGGQAVLPAKAVVKDCLIDVLTPLTPAPAEMSLGLTTVNDLKAALAVGSYTGRVACIPTGSAATMIKVGSTRSSVIASFTVGAVTAGKFNVFIEYYLSD